MKWVITICCVVITALFCNDGYSQGNVPAHKEQLNQDSLQFTTNEKDLVNEP